MSELGTPPADKDYKPSGISRAEERAMEIYPVEICGYTVECRVGAKPEPQDWNEERRKCFQEGYETAEKDTKDALLEWANKKLQESADRLDFHANQAYAEVIYKLNEI